MLICILITLIQSQEIPPLWHQTPDSYNRTQALSTTNGLNSPYNVFLSDDMGVQYYTHVHIQSKNSMEKYKVSIDINLPFTIITEQIGNDNQQKYTKMIPTSKQVSLFIKFMEQRLPQIEQYKQNISIVTSESIFWINDDLSTNQLSFFYLSDIGAAYFRYITNLDGYIGLAVDIEYEKPAVMNLVACIFQNHILSNASFSLYYGNQQGFIDSLLFLGGFQSIFRQENQEFQKLNVYKSDLHNYCIRMDVNIILAENTLYEQKNLTGCLSSIYPFIQLPYDILQNIKAQIENETTIQCYNYTQIFQNMHYDVLRCHSKIPYSEDTQYPTIVLKMGKTISRLEPQNYNHKCIYDRVNYAQICTTVLAYKNNINNTFNLDQSQSDIILGLPFLRVYYTYFNLHDQSLSLAQSYQYPIRPLYSEFWYYSLLVILFCWCILMMTCGMFYKAEMSNMMKFTNNIIRYILGNQEARQQLLQNYFNEE